MKMSQVEMAMLLLAIVISVLVATRPVPPKRRRPPSQRPREDKPDPTTRRSSVLLSRRTPQPANPDPSHRNHWDRADIAAGVGRDHAHPDLTLTLWPESR